MGVAEKKCIYSPSNNPIAYLSHCMGDSMHEGIDGAAFIIKSKQTNCQRPMYHPKGALAKSVCAKLRGNLALFPEF